MIACLIHLTCSYKKNARTEEDIVCLVVDPAHTDTHAPEHQQGGTEDGEHTGGTNDTCRKIERTLRMILTLING